MNHVLRTEKLGKLGSDSFHMPSMVHMGHCYGQGRGCLLDLFPDLFTSGPESGKVISNLPTIQELTSFCSGTRMAPLGCGCDSNLHARTFTSKVSDEQNT